MSSSQSSSQQQQEQQQEQQQKQQQQPGPPPTCSSQLDMAQGSLGWPVSTLASNMGVLGEGLPLLTEYRPAYFGQAQQQHQRFDANPPPLPGPAVQGSCPTSTAVPVPASMLQHGLFTREHQQQQQSYYVTRPSSPQQQQQAHLPQYYAFASMAGFQLLTQPSLDTNLVRMGCCANSTGPLSGISQPQPAPTQASYYCMPPAEYPGHMPYPNFPIPPCQQYGAAALHPGHAALPTQSQVMHYSPYYGRGGDAEGLTLSGREQGLGRGRGKDVVRGPPRKPRQSGHAIWIGNLPPQTDLMILVQHACKEAAGLESLFLIPRTHCAFANFKNEASCVAAQQKLHDSKFQGVRLVSRLRKKSVEGAAGVIAPIVPANIRLQRTAAPPNLPASAAKPTESAAASLATAEGDPISVESGTGPETETGRGVQGQKDKFFILKSLTVQDLELSVRTKIWATQSHNEEALNEAFKAADNVYLIFSANKSGEYFGCARMISPINLDPAAAIVFAPKCKASSELDLPKVISTEATEFAPRGRIIDDSARGTIFWEVVGDEAEVEDKTGLQKKTKASKAPEETKSLETRSTAGEGARVSESSLRLEQGVDGAAECKKAWGKPFRLEWLSTNRLPFYHTRGLRNPWNANRVVKVARDGTALEPVLGRRLMSLFHRLHNPNFATGQRQGQDGHAGRCLTRSGSMVGPLTMIPNFPPALHARFPYTQPPALWWTDIRALAS